MNIRARIFVLVSAVAMVLVPPAAHSQTFGPGTHPSFVPTITDPNILCDPDFESGGYSCWEKVSLDEPNTAEITEVSPRSGRYSADLCSAATDSDRCVGGLVQSVAVPDHVQSAELRFWVRGLTNQGGNDCMTVIILAVAIDMNVGECEAAQNGAWTEFVSTTEITQVLKNHEGSDVEVLLWTAKPSDDHGYAYIDDLSLRVTSYQEASYSRELTLGLKDHLQTTGNLSLETDGPGRCWKHAPVKIQRKADGKWKTLATVETNATGTYESPVGDKPGKYRAVAPPLLLFETQTCKRAVSHTKTHTH